MDIPFLILPMEYLDSGITHAFLSELNNAADIAHKRIYDRILERCIPVRINNRNIRQDNATANLKQVKKILLNNHAPNQNWLEEV